jgi:hypothetical protein
MPPTCNKCRTTYLQATNSALVCVGCGDLLPPLVATGSGERREVIEEQSPVGGCEGSIGSIAANATLNPEKSAGGSTEVSGLLPVDQPKSPGLAALLSFLLVGMGQIYLGQVEKGLCMLGVVLLVIMSAALSPLGVVILFLNVLDAFLVGRRVRQGQQVRRWQFFFHSK